MENGISEWIAPTAPDDPEWPRSLVHAAIEGDSGALATAFEFYRPRLVAIALKLCGNTATAKDAVQDTFLSAWAHLSQLREPSSFYPWLKQILRSHCLQFLMNERRQVDKDLMRLCDERWVDRSLERHLETVDTHQWLYGALLSLSNELRACVMIRYFSAFNSYEEIALMLGVPIGTVRSRLAAARMRLASQPRVQPGVALAESRKWSDFYHHAWSQLYDDGQIPHEFVRHFAPSAVIRYSSGETAIGKAVVEREMNEDLRHGSLFRVEQVASSGNITVVEGTNTNSAEYPDRCPPATVFVHFRRNDRVERFHIFHSPRPRS